MNTLLPSTAVVWLWRMARLVLIVGLVLVLMMMFFENSLIFFPSRYPNGDWQPTGFRFEDAWFQAGDGTRLHGWYIAHPHARAAVLFCHGNGGNITDRAFAAQMLRGHVSVSVLLFDYRGYGRSEGRPNGAGILADARAARKWLAEREKIAERDVVVMGESIGGAVAVDLAARDGARALVLENTFNSLADVAAYHYPWLPVRWAMRTRLDSAGLIGGYHGPLFQAHGDADAIVPIRFGRRLFDAAHEPKTFFLMRGHNHNDRMPPEYYEALAEFVAGLK
jgi:uncharacterized protein